MLISDVLSAKGHDVVKVRPFAHVVTAVRKLAEFRIGALVVESQWMRPIGIFSERDFVNAIARDGAAALGFEVHQLMSSPILSCLSSDRIDAVLARIDSGQGPSHAGHRPRRTRWHRQHRRPGEAPAG